MQLQFLTSLAGDETQGTFLAALLFAILYHFLRFRWWESVTGRAWMTLDLAVAGSLLHSVLIAWDVPTIQIRADGVHGNYLGAWYDAVLTWFSILCQGAAGLAILVLTWQTLQYAVAEAQAEPERKHSRLVRALSRSEIACRLLKLRERDTVR